MYIIMLTSDGMDPWYCALVKLSTDYYLHKRYVVV